MIPIILTITVVTIVYYLLHLNYQYWKKRGIANPKPVFLLGNFGKCFFLRASPGQVYYDVYNKYKNEQVVGLYRATTPVLLVRDPELIKEVMMKWLYPLLDEVAENLVKFIENQPKTLNAKDVCARFTLNNVASCAFGIEGKCFEEENNHFRQMAIEFLSPSSWSFIGLFLVLLNPSLLKVLPIKFVTKNCEKKLIDLVQQTVKYREDNNVVRNDFLHILTQLKKTSSEFTDIDVVAHAAGFFGDGYETTAGVMSFVLYCLAENLDIQTKLRELVDKVFENNEEKLPYEALQEIHFLDAVVNETLRLHPPALHFQKLCTQDFTFVLKNANKSVTIEKGTPVILPVYGLHHDPDYYESPDLFKPERFLPENKDKTVKCTFMPFGEGPRSCLGQRFGLLQVKVGVAHIIRHFELSVNGKTQRPIKYEPTNPVTAPVGGFWVNFRKIR
nr:PREDICTED: probable cytochrome P450 6a13 isoform X2 [Tribolium castaneum]|eukprot:XP_015839583.1 PREDICTED: probable cytochrome P450 6a13 isoform X2 [Tribolium castaneum]